MQLILNADTIKYQAKRRGNQTEYHSWQSHFRLSNASISTSEEISRAIAGPSTAEYAYQSTNNGGDEAKPGLIGSHVVGRGIRGCDIGGHGYDEADCYGLNEGGPENGGKENESKWTDEKSPE